MWRSAVVSFEAMFASEEHIKDYLGPTVKLARRVAVKVKDQIIFRDGQEKSKSVEMMEKAQKNAGQAELDKLSQKLARQDSWKASAGRELLQSQRKPHMQSGMLRGCG